MTVHALVDTGNCWRTAIAPELAEALGFPRSSLKALEEPVRLCTADEAQPLTVLGEVPADIRFKALEAGVSFTLRPVVIKGLAGGVNLGGPLLNVLGWSVDAEKSVVRTTDGVELGLRPVHERRVSAIRAAELSEEEAFIPAKFTKAKVRVAASMTIPANSTTLVPLRLDSDTRGWRGRARDADLEGTATFMSDTDLHPALRAVVRFDKDGRSRGAVCNTQDYDIKLPAGIQYGVAEIATLVSKKETEEAKKARKEQLQKEMTSAGFKKYGPEEQRRFLVRCFRLEESPFLTNEVDLWKCAEFLRQYWDSFAWDGSYGTTDLLTHHIKLKEGARPVKCRYRPLPRPMEESCEAQVKTWLDAGVIEPSTSPWSSNLLAVKKKSGEIR